jgi:putative N6-adenine-specific DNA methylase
MIGTTLKNEFSGNDAWILSYREECFRQIGLKPSIKIPLYNGSLECEFRKYSMFNGKFNVFRSEGGSIKSEEEKRQMAEKHRFKKNREFKQRLEEEEENEENDIRSFKFRAFDATKFDFGKKDGKRNDDRHGNRHAGKGNRRGKDFDNEERDINFASKKRNERRAKRK